MMNSYPGLYGQVLTNLFLNAVTHGLDETSGGRITVNARRLNDEQVEINFSDDGKGMPEAVQRAKRSTHSSLRAAATVERDLDSISPTTS
jgi:signal transduction histidine kinase